MGRLIDACFRLLLCIALLCAGVGASWYFAAGRDQLSPRLRVVTARPLVAETKLAAKHLATELAWLQKDAPRIGQASQVIGAKLKADILTPRPLIWDDVKIVAAETEEEAATTKSEADVPASDEAGTKEKKKKK